MNENCWVKLSPNKCTIVLAFSGLVYLLLGAVIIFFLEKDVEAIRRKELQTITGFYKKKYQISEEDYIGFKKALIEFEPYERDIQWSFIGSLYFAITVVTTIGYGHTTPQTNGGKIFCIAYACVGIPLFLVMFHSIGERWNSGIRRFFRFSCRKLCFPCTEELHGCMVPFGIFTCCSIVAVGSVAFVYFEQWTMLESIYYCVMTLTTIGFGDFVALQQRKDLSSNPLYVTFCFAYILLGLTLIGAFLNLVVLQKIVRVPHCDNHRYDRACQRFEEADEEQNNSDSDYLKNVEKIVRSKKKKNHKKLQSRNSNKSLDDVISTCEIIQPAEATPSNSLSLINERRKDLPERRFSANPKIIQSHLYNTRCESDSATDSGPLTSIESDQEVSQHIKRFKKTVWKLNERRKHQKQVTEPPKKLSMLLDICGKPKNVDSSLKIHKKNVKCSENETSQSCEIKNNLEVNNVSSIDHSNLIHSRTTSWPLSHSQGDKVDSRTVSWVRNTLNVLTAGAFTDFVSHQQAYNCKPESSSTSNNLPSILITSSSLANFPSPDSTESEDGNVFTSSSPVDKHPEMLFLLPPITFESPASTRRFSGDSGYSGTQSFASTTTSRRLGEGSNLSGIPIDRSNAFSSSNR